MKHDVTLIVKGPVGSGKGVVLTICEDALIAAGYYVSKVKEQRGKKSVEVKQL